MKPIYHIEQRLAFIARNECVINDKIPKVIKGVWKHYVGYVKQVRRSLFGVQYVMLIPKTGEIYIVPQRDIIGVVEKRENDSNKSINNPNE